MKKHEFKKGDKVRIVGNGDNVHTVRHHFDIGDVGEISHAHPNDNLLVVVGDLEQYVAQEHVEIVKEGQA